MKGGLTGSENFVIDGQVEGTINLRENLLTIGPSVNISAEILPKSVIVLGRHRGHITGTEKVEIQERASCGDRGRGPLSRQYRHATG
tara:strand:+ start:276 stop:536 length:261 start_codon:yes stop_codon:yes gene_type:complete